LEATQKIALLCKLVAGLILAISCCTVSAEEKVKRSEAMGESTLGKFSLYTYGGPFRFSLSPEATGDRSSERFQAIQSWQWNTIFQSHSGTPVDDESL